MNIENLIGQIYDCVEDEGQWPAVLCSLFDAFGCSGASLQSHSLATNELCFSHAVGFDQTWIDEYLNVWRQRDAFADALVGRFLSASPAARQSPVRAGFFFGSAGYKKTVVYQEFMRKSGFDDYMVLPVDVKNDLSGIGLWCGPKQGTFSDEQFNAAQIIAPHLVRAKNISDKLSYAKQYEAAGDTAVVDGPCIVVDQHLRCLESNELAEELIESGKILRRLAGQICFCGADAEKEIRRQVLFHSDDDGLKRGTPVFFEVNLAFGAVARFYHLPASTIRRNLNALRREYLIVISRAMPFFTIAVQKMAKKYDLTQAEESVASSLLLGLSITEISELRKTKISTTRWHLKQLFSKFGVSSQRALLSKLLLQ